MKRPQITQEIIDRNYPEQLTTEEVIQNHDRAVIDAKDIKEAAMKSALEIVLHIDCLRNFGNPVCIVARIITEQFSGFTKR